MKLSDLKAKLRNAKKDGSSKVVEILNDIGHFFRDVKHDPTSAIEAYVEAADLAQKIGVYNDGCFAVRALSEIYAELGDRGQALGYAGKFREIAKTSGIASQEQLSSHVTAWVYERLWICQSSDKADLEKAFEWVEISLNYLKQNTKRIDDDKQAVKIACDSRRRKAGLERLGAGIAANLGNRAAAERLWNSSYDFARSTKDVGLIRVLLQSKLDFSWADTIQTARELLRRADERHKGPALIECANQYVLHGHFESALHDLKECYRTEQRKKMEKYFPNDFELLLKRLPICFKYVDLRKMLKQSNLKKKEIRDIYEMMGDLVCDYDDKNFSTPLMSLACGHYIEMLSACEDDKSVIKAKTAIALTEMDISNFERAKKLFVDVLELQNKLSFDIDKILDTKLSILSCDRRLNPCHEEFERETARLEAAIRKSSQKIELYQICKKYYEDKGDSSNAELFKRRERNVEEDDSQELEEEEEDELQEDGLVAQMKNLTDAEIFEYVRRELEEETSLAKLQEKRDRVNHEGETKLHEEAKKEGSSLLPKLIKFGYDLNKKDNAGWTPLSEAVNHGCVKNVRLLVEAGAKVDEVCDGEITDNETRFGSGVTPLMEACLMGEIEIAIILMNSGASVVKRNADGRTCLDCLLLHMETLEDGAELWRAQKLEEEIIKKQRILGFDNEKKPPMRRRSLENNSPRQRIEAHKTVDRMSSSRRSSLSPTPMPSLLLRASPSHFVDTIDIDDDETEFEQRRLTRKKRKRDEFEFSHGTVHKRPNNPFRTPPGTDVLKSRGNFLPESVQSMKSPRNSLASPNERKITGMLTARLSPSPVSRDNHVRIDDFEDFRSRSSRSSSNMSAGTSASNLREKPKDICVRIDFKDPNRSNLMLMFPRTSNIGDVRSKVEKELGKKYDVRLSHDNYQLADDNIPLSKDGFGDDVTFGCQLATSTPTEMYRHMTEAGDRVAEVEEMLKTFETENILNLEGLFLNSDRLRKVMEIVQFSSKPGTSVVFTRCEIDENSLQMARTTASKAKAVKMNGIRACEDPMEALFEGEDLLELQKLDISSLELKATESFENLLRRAPKLRHLVMAAARISPTFNPSRAVSAISKMQNLVELDLSYCTWIKGDDWGSAFGSLDTLAKLRIISVDLKNVEFEITWLPSLTDLNVCGSKLEWSSFMEWVGTSSLTRLDVSSTDITVEQLAEVGEHRGGRLPLAVIARRLRSVDEDRLHSLLKPLAEAKVDLVL